jgi:hypothetical protein
MKKKNKKQNLGIGCQTHKFQEMDFCGVERFEDL